MKLKILLLSIIISNNTFCQDLIIKRDSSKIFCKIIKEDSLSLYYIPSKNNQKTELSINKSEVLKYHSSLAVAKTNRNKLDTASKIYNAKILIKGFYKSYAEYISNSPSLAKEVIAVKRTSGDLILMHGSDYGYSLNGQTTNLGEYYGFCDGNNAYMLVQVSRVDSALADEEAKKTALAELEGAVAAEYVSSYAKSLKAKTEVVVNRKLLESKDQ